MELKKLIDKFREELPKNYTEYSIAEHHKIYNVFSGYLNNRSFDIYFRETFKGAVSIEVAHTTDEPEYWVAIIKGIDPSAKVLYAIKEIKYKIV